MSSFPVYSSKAGISVSRPLLQIAATGFLGRFLDVQQPVRFLFFNEISFFPCILVARENCRKGLIYIFSELAVSYIRAFHQTSHGLIKKKAEGGPETATTNPLENIHVADMEKKQQ